MQHRRASRPRPGYLEGVRASSATEHGAVLIFDEVITGFRLAPGGAQELLRRHARPRDLRQGDRRRPTRYACSRGRADLMDAISRVRSVTRARSTQSARDRGAPRRRSRELTQGRRRRLHRLAATGNRLMDGIRAAAEEAGVAMLVDGPGHDLPDVSHRPARGRATTASSRQPTSPAWRGSTRGLLERGVSIVGRGLWFLSTAHDDADVDATLAVVADALASR